MTESLSEQGVSRVYIVRRGELAIDAPVDRVWPKLVDYGSWQNYSILAHVSGPVGGEGEVVHLQKAGTGAPGTPYYARTIRIEPGHRIMWKTFREGGDYFGIVDFAIDDVDGRTRFSYSNVYEHVLHTTDEAEVEAFRSEREAALTTLVSTIFPQLKRLVERGD